MIVRLFCPVCAYEAPKKLDSQAVLDIPVPVSRLSDDGIYNVQCSKGHISRVILNNVKFELLFEMGLHAMVDGYPKEAVSSFAAALERFYEFYWFVTMRHFDIPDDTVKSTWKTLSKFSERQIGAYSTAAIFLTNKTPKLLNTHKEVPFRNKVIHNGYIPKENEAISFGNSVMTIMNKDIANLRSIAPEALELVYQEFCPQASCVETSEKDNNIVVGSTNILTAINVLHPPNKDDNRTGDVTKQLTRIHEYRGRPKRMELLSKEEVARRFPNKKFSD